MAESDYAINQYYRDVEDGISNDGYNTGHVASVVYKPLYELSDREYERDKMKIIGSIKNDNPGVYMITNVVEDKIYIGSSGDIKVRWESHVHDLNCGRHHNYLLQQDWNRLKQRNFAFEVIWEAPIESDRNEIFEMEDLYIKQHTPEYNIAKVQLRRHNYNPAETTRLKKEKFKEWVNSRKVFISDSESKKKAMHYVIKTCKNEFRVHVRELSAGVYELKKNNFTVRVETENFSINGVVVLEGKARPMIVLAAKLFGYTCEFDGRIMIATRIV